MKTKEETQKEIKELEIELDAVNFQDELPKFKEIANKLHRLRKSIGEEVF